MLAPLELEMFSKVYGWTPEEIRKQKCIDLQNYRTILEVRAENGRAET